ncbi:MAG TPA: hypothetical protein VGW39_08070 [Chthoniobacterales bacterium]|nr:hypothetical protein [Chthoniobacterales bacterium]
MIKNKLLFAALLGASVLLPVAAIPAQSISISIGDRPYYRHGPHYWAGDYQMIWVPGHRSGRHWVHGRYVRGENRRYRSYRRHDDRRYDRSDDRRDYRDERRDDRRY